MNDRRDRKDPSQGVWSSIEGLEATADERHRKVEAALTRLAEAAVQLARRTASVERRVTESGEDASRSKVDEHERALLAVIQRLRKVEASVETLAEALLASG